MWARMLASSRVRRSSVRHTALRCDRLEVRETPAAPIVNFGDGFDPGRMSGWFAGIVDGQLLLTDGPYQGRGAWSGTRVDVRGFQTSFVFHHGPVNPDFERPLGDGITFALQSRSFPPAGSAGGGLGYQGLVDSVAIKFDLVDNAGEGADSVGVYTGGAEPTGSSISLDGTGIDLHNGHPFRADITYDGAELSLTLTDTIVPALTWTHDFDVDIPAALRASTGYVGFTAGTGELDARQAILSWTYAEEAPTRSANEPPRIDSASAASAGTALAILMAQAQDDGGAENLRYHWSVVSAPAGASPVIDPTPGDHVPGMAHVQLDRAGTYRFLVAVQDDAGMVSTQIVSLVQSPIVLDLDVIPGATTLSSGESQTFIAIALDQFGQPMDVSGVEWQLVSGPGTMAADGTYTAPGSGSGTAIVRATFTVDPPFPGEPPREVSGEARVILHSGPAGGGLDFGGGFGSAELNENGSAAIVDSRLRLASGAHQAGSAYALTPVDVRGFTTSFRFQIGSESGSGFGDGLTFILQNAGAGALGAGGGGLGSQGIVESVAIKFDLVDNAGEGSSSVGVYVGGAVPTTPADSLTSGGPLNHGIHLGNGRVYEVRLSYAGGTLMLDLRDPMTGEQFSRAYEVDIPAVVGGSTAFAGFTAGTGELFAPIDVLSWTYTSTADPSGNAAPTIVQGPAVDSYYVRGVSAQLMARAVDDDPEADLTYTWEVLSSPTGAAPVRFSANGINAAKETTVTFDRSGMYTFRLVVTDASGNATVSSPLWVEVGQTPGTFAVLPAAPTVVNDAAVAISVAAFDQFGDPLTSGAGTWQFEVDGPGYMDSSHHYHAPSTGTGPVAIRATNGTISGTATLFVVDRTDSTSAAYRAGFADFDRLVFNGSASEESSWARITSDGSGQAGSLFHATPLDVTGFDSRFRIRLGGPDFTANPGSGITFAIHSVGPTAIGSGGNGLGYEGIDRSLAIAFFPTTNSFGLATQGTMPSGTTGLDGTGIDLRAGHDLLVDVCYDGNVLTVDITDEASGATIRTPFTIDIPAIVGGDRAYIGFTGATGTTVDPFAAQNITGWEYRAVPPGASDQPPTIVRSARLVARAAYDPRWANFQVRASDDGGLVHLRQRWELISAPAGSSPWFDRAGISPIHFDQTGTYVFRVIVTDGHGQTVTDEAVYEVGPA